MVFVAQIIYHLAKRMQRPSLSGIVASLFGVFAHLPLHQASIDQATGPLWVATSRNPSWEDSFVIWSPYAVPRLRNAFWRTASGESTWLCLETSTKHYFIEVAMWWLPSPVGTSLCPIVLVSWWLTQPCWNELPSHMQSCLGNSRLCLKMHKSKGSSRVCAQNMHHFSGAKRVAQIQPIARTAPMIIFWTVRRQSRVKQGAWGKSHQKVHPKLCPTSCLWHLFCPWTSLVRNLSTLAFWGHLQRKMTPKYPFGIPELFLFVWNCLDRLPSWHSYHAGGNYRIHDLFGGAWISRICNAFFT